MNSLYCICLSFILQTSQIFSDDDVKWFNDEWLTEPKDGESRPAWWYDVWGLDGLIIVASVEEDNNQSKFDWREISIINPSAENDEIVVQKIRLSAKNLKIHKIVSISKALKLEHLGVMESSVIKVFDIGSFMNKLGIYRYSNKYIVGEKYIFFLKRGGYMSEELNIDYVMPLDRLDGIKKIVEAAVKSP